jgi:hypothetical protein
MSGTLANTSTQRLTDVQSAAANGGYNHLSHRQHITLRSFLAVLAVNLRQPATDGTEETTSAGMVPLLLGAMRCQCVLHYMRNAAMLRRLRPHMSHWFGKTEDDSKEIRS